MTGLISLAFPISPQLGPGTIVYLLRATSYHGLIATPAAPISTNIPQNIVYARYLSCLVILVKTKSAAKKLME